MKLNSLSRLARPAAVFLTLAAALPCPAAGDPERPQTQIIVPDSGLAGTDRIELRFPAPMTGSALAGSEVNAETLLDIKPALPATFRWQSTRSGTLEPTGLLALGSRYRISLKKGLTDAEGAAVPAATAVTVNGPAFSVVRHTPRWFSPGSDTTRQPEITLYFNDAVSAAAAGKAAAFTDKDGNRVAATAVTPRISELGKNPPTTGTWQEQQSPEATAADPDAAAISVVMMKPATPLPPGTNWQLVIGNDLPNRSGTARTPETYTVNYGTIAPFAFRSAEAEPQLDSQRQLHISYNKRLPELDAKEWPKWIQVEPFPANATWETSGGTVTLTGDFTQGGRYQVIIAPGLTAADGTVLMQGAEESVTFAAHDPHLSLPAFSQSQWIGGRGDFTFSTANLRNATVKVKRVSPETAVFLLNGYRTYEYDESSDGGGHTRIPYNAVAGRTVWEKELPSAVPLDHSERFGFTWDEANGGQRQPGIYFVSVEGRPKEEVTTQKTLGAQAVVQLTDIGLAWKFAGDDCVLYAFSQTSGLPAEGVTLRTFTDENEPLESRVTAADGMARLTFGKARWLLAQKGEDLHGVAFNEDMPQLSMWAFDMPFSENRPDKAEREMMLFTERPVYQPGETVYFKAITRLHDATGLKLPPEKETAKLQLIDPQRRVCQERDIEFTASGAFADGLRLPADTLGWYRLRIIFPKKGAAADKAAAGGEEVEEDEEDTGSSAFEESLLVQQYQPNAFRLTFDSAAAVKDGETLQVPLRAAYFMGKPLGESALTWTSRLAQSTFRPDQWPDYRFGHARSYYVWDGQEYHSMDEEDWAQPLLTGQATTKLSAKGEAVIEAKVPANFGVPGPKAITVSAEVTDLNQQTIAETWTRVEHSSDFYLGVRREKSAVAAGSTLPVSIVAVQQDGSRVTTPVPVHVLVEHLTWNATRVQTAGGGTEVRNDLVFARVGEEDLTISPEPGKEEAWTFQPEVAGTHNLTFTATDRQGRAIRTVVSVDVYGADDMTWQQKDGVKIELVTDKERYLPGETARIVVKSPLKGTALVSIERDRVLTTMLKPLEPGGVIELPVDESWAPNVFVSVMQVRGGADDPKQNRQPDYRAGFCELKVTGLTEKLNVELTPAEPEVRPGAMVNVVARVLDAAGKPVPDAEVALWAVDEGILSLMPWNAPDAYGFFHYDSSLYVHSGISLQQLLTENPDELEFANKGFVIGGGSDDFTGGPGKSLRKDFKPTAYWHGSLLTGEDGAVEVSFPAPDNLTSFRVVAVVTEGAARFGTAESSFKVNKPLMIEPALPRFANVGDQITIKAVLHNTTTRDAAVTLTLTPDEHIRILDPKTREPLTADTFTTTTQLGAQQSVALPIPVQFVADGPVVLEWAATSAGDAALQDAVQSKFSVGFAEPLLRDVKFLTIAAGRNGENLLTDIRPELLEGAGEITVTVANSRILEGSEAVMQLLHYPYGCAEQTMSALLPWLTLRDLKKAIPSLSRPDEEIANVLQMGCDRLLTMQTRDGGLAYWPGGAEPSAWASAHGAVGLTLASRSGANVPPARLNALLSWLSDSLRDTAGETGDWSLTERAYAAWALALAGKPEPGYHEVLYKNRQHLPPAARALAALAIAESDGPAGMARALLSEKRQNDPDVWWGSSSTLAMRIMALHKLKDPSADTEMGRLLAQRSPRGDWNSTFANAWTLMALAREAADSTPWPAEKPVVLTFAGKTSEIALPAEPAAESATFTHPAGKDLPALSLTVSPGQKAFVRLDIATRQRPGPQPARSQGFTLARTWQRVNPDGSVSPTGALRTGDLVLCSLDLDIPGPADYLVIDDPLPATFEGVNPHFTSMAGTGAQVAAADQRPAWFSDYTEMRRDRVLFFRDHFTGRGSFRVQYLARVIAEGTVTVPAAKVEMMYDPTRFGLSPAGQLTTEPAPEGVAVK